MGAVCVHVAETSFISASVEKDSSKSQQHHNSHNTARKKVYENVRGQL